MYWSQTPLRDADFSFAWVDFTQPLGSIPLNITTAGGNVVVSWTTNSVGYSLESTTNLALPPSWTLAPSPAVVGAEYRLTNSAAGTKFFRLRKL